MASASSSSAFSTYLPPPVKLQEELRASKDELKKVDEDLKKLRARQRELTKKISTLKASLDLVGEGAEAAVHFDQDNFPWSDELNRKLKSVFCINEFRSYQKSAINATMSGVDCILIMPTGGGKSLCFQLPAILSASIGVTLVVSPLISLMEDQLQALKALKISTSIFNAQTTRDESREIFRQMTCPKSDLKMLYVTPEKLAKSKTLMSNLEKMYRSGRFARLVIDEVHCCSQWGHDFRPDYKFLGIMKTQYPKTPIIGLTATATANVIVDVQKILNIEGSLLLKDSFFRANLKYEVLDIPSKDKADDIADLINTRFPGQSGIVYCLTIKDTQEVARRLKELGIQSDCYHAQLEPDDRTQIQRRWYNGGINVIVATVAFGMGINKLDVRFVIHHSMSKSVENYYQETGRAGRDGEPAWCILYYRFLDTFRASALIFTEKNGVNNVYNMLMYSTNRDTCRKALLAKHFGDPWETEGCGEMCDNCEIFGSPNLHEYENIDAAPLLQDVLKLLEQADLSEERMTALKLMDAWFGKGNKKNRVEGVSVPTYSRQICETILAKLLTDGYLKEDFHFTPYSTISYLKPGNRTCNGDKFIYKILVKNGLEYTRKSYHSLKVKSKPATIYGEQKQNNEIKTSNPTTLKPKFTFKNATTTTAAAIAKSLQMEMTKRIIEEVDDEIETPKKRKINSPSSKKETKITPKRYELVDLDSDSN